MIEDIHNLEPIITIITVSRNRKFYLDELLKSLENQTFKNFEIILIENASNIETLDYVKNVQLKNIFIKKIYLNEEQTISYCRNIPFKNNLIKPTTKYVYFIDDDDLLQKDALRRMFKKMNSTNADVLVINTIQAFCTNKLYGNVLKYISLKEVFKNLLHGWRFKIFGQLFFERDMQWTLLRWHNDYYAMNSYMFEISLFKFYLFNEQITYGEDTLFLSDISDKVNKFEIIPSLFAIYRRHGDNTRDAHNLKLKTKANPLTKEYIYENFGYNYIYVIFFMAYLRALRDKYIINTNDEKIKIENLEILHTFSLFINSISVHLKIRSTLYYMPNILVFTLRSVLIKILFLLNLKKHIHD